MLTSSNPRLNEQQLDMIRLFKKPMPEEDFIEMRRLAVQLLNKRLGEIMDNWERENYITDETYELWGNEHMRSSYKQSE